MSPAAPAPTAPSEVSEKAAVAHLQAENLVRRFGKRTVVNEVSLAVHGGEIVGLLGPNGAGKTTTFYLLVGLIRPHGGQITLDGCAITKQPMFRRARLGLGYLPQEPSVFRRLSVEQNLRAIAETLPINGRARRERVAQLLEQLGLEKLATQRAYTLSGGERRRLEIARALVTSPKFLLMDEPFSGVDPISVGEVQEVIRSLRDQGIGIIITDHNVRETLSVVDRALLLHEGRVLAEGTSEFLVNDEQSRRLYLGERFEL